MRDKLIVAMFLLVSLGTVAAEQDQVEPMQKTPVFRDLNSVKGAKA